MKKIWPMIAVAIVVLSSCKKDNNNSTSEQNYPPPDYLQVGHKWTYDLSGYTIYSKMEQEITAVNNGIYTSVFSFDGTPEDPAFLYAQGEYLNSFEGGESKAANQRYTKYVNVKLGDKWTKIGSTSYNYEVTAVDTSITVPAGTFLCDAVKVISSSSLFDQYNYYSRQFGLIKTDNIAVTTELKSKNF